MNFSNFGQKFTQNSGILQLMDDLGKALNSDTPVNMLGGGNPAHIPEVSDAYHRIFTQLAEQADGVIAKDSMGSYAAPQGDAKFILALVDFFNQTYGWQLTADNIALTNGSQNAFFYLFNLFSGRFGTGDSAYDKSILLPLAPEYVGYADAHIEGSHFVATPPIIEEVTHEGKAGFFKYRVDFEALKSLPALKNGEIGAICCSRPTNPTGNVLTDDEMAQLDDIARTHDIPLIIDNAYGMPFPNIIHTKATLTWHDNIVLCFSLSKIGLAGLRTGIVVAHPDIIKAISSLNAIVNLAPTRFGAAIATPLIESGQMTQLANEHIKPFYAKQSATAIALIQEAFADYPVYIHKPEGAIFLWLWFKDLPISTQTLYERLKAIGTLVIPSAHFFVGLDTANYRHAHECIRISIAQPDEVLRQGIQAIAKVVCSAYNGE